MTDLFAILVLGLLQQMVAQLVVKSLGWMCVPVASSTCSMSSALARTPLSLGVLPQKKITGFAPDALLSHWVCLMHCLFNVILY